MHPRILLKLFPPKTQAACESVAREGKYTWDCVGAYTRILITCSMALVYILACPCEGLAIQEQA